MIDREGDARIMDFGIARSMKGERHHGGGVMIGTPEYMSPEQVEGKEIDAAVRYLFSGFILYEMVTGRVPFEGDTPFTVGVKQKSETPKEICKHLPDDLSRLILKCLEKAKENRYQNVEELRCELEKIAKGIPTAERIALPKSPFTSKEITVKFSFKKLSLPAFILVAVMLAAVIIWRPFSKKLVTPAPPGRNSIAVLPFADLSPAKDREYLCEGIADTLINALTNIKDLRVPGRTSSFSFKGREPVIREIGQKLNVSTVLEEVSRLWETNFGSQPRSPRWMMVTTSGPTVMTET